MCGLKECCCHTGWVESDCECVCGLKECCCHTGWVESDLEMTSVSSTRELRPVPKMLIQMVHDLSSLPVIYHGWSKEEGGGEGGGEGREPEGSHPVNTPVEQVCRC